MLSSRSSRRRGMRISQILISFWWDKTLPRHWAASVFEELMSDRHDSSKTHCLEKNALHCDLVVSSDLSASTIIEFSMSRAFAMLPVGVYFCAKLCGLRKCTARADWFLRSFPSMRESRSPVIFWLCRNVW